MDLKENSLNNYEFYKFWCEQNGYNAVAPQTMSRFQEELIKSDRKITIRG